MRADTEVGQGQELQKITTSKIRKNINKLRLNIEVIKQSLEGMSTMQCKKACLLMREYKVEKARLMHNIRARKKKEILGGIDAR